jgi:hypothetical protein
MQTKLPRKRRVKPLPPIAGHEFRTVADLERAINSIRQNYRPHNQPLTGPDGELMHAWMRHHQSIEDAELHHGPMQCIEVRHNTKVTLLPGRPECDQYQLWLCFQDGYSEPFSYRADANEFGVQQDGYASARRQLKWVKSAGRCLIGDDIRDYLSFHLDNNGTCEVSGQALTIDSAEVHHNGHKRGFQWLLFCHLGRWCERNGCDLSGVVVIDTDSEGGKRFADDDLCEQWILFHSIRADLQVVHGAVHRQLHKGVQPPPWIDLFSVEACAA